MAPTLKMIREEQNSSEQMPGATQPTSFDSAARINARMRVCFGPGSRILTGYSVNLSSGGLFLETDILLDVDDPLLLEFELPNSRRKIRCRGRVAWVNRPDIRLKSNFPSGMGVQFLNLSLDDMEALREFVKKNLIFPVW